MKSEVTLKMKDPTTVVFPIVSETLNINDTFLKDLKEEDDVQLLIGSVVKSYKNEDFIFNKRKYAFVIDLNRADIIDEVSRIKTFTKIIVGRDDGKQIVYRYPGPDIIL